MPFQVQVVSDLHLERDDGHDGEFPAVAPYLMLAGDVGDPSSPRYAEFLGRQADRYRRVFAVLGNHEWYGNVDALSRAREAASRFPNVHVLEKDAVDVDGFRVLGTTLWSEVDYQTACVMSDARCIPGWTHRSALDEHRTSADWLAGRLREDVPTVVLTHHAPLTGFTSAPRHAGSPFESGFASDLSRLVRPPVLAWFHGHTHWSHERRVNGVLVASNAAGLAGEDTRFDPARAFAVA